MTPKSLAHIFSVDKDSDPDSESSYILRLQGQKITALMHYKELLAKTSGVQRYKHIIVVDMTVCIAGAFLLDVDWTGCRHGRYCIA